MKVKISLFFSRQASSLKESQFHCHAREGHKVSREGPASHAYRPTSSLRVFQPAVILPLVNNPRSGHLFKGIVALIVFFNISVFAQTLDKEKWIVPKTEKDF